VLCLTAAVLGSFMVELHERVNVIVMFVHGQPRLLKTGVRYSLPQQELVNNLLFPHAFHNQPVQIDKQSATKTTSDPANRHTQPVWSVDDKTENHSVLKQSQLKN